MTQDGARQTAEDILAVAEDDDIIILITQTLQNAYNNGVCDTRETMEPEIAELNEQLTSIKKRKWNKNLW